MTANELLTVIRAHCLECSGGSRTEAERCRVVTCSLYPFRTASVQKEISKESDMLKGQISFSEIMEGQA